VQGTFGRRIWGIDGCGGERDSKDEEMEAKAIDINSQIFGGVALGQTVKPEWLPKTLPTTWAPIEFRLDGTAFKNIIKGLVVIVSLAEEQDGKRWLHVSCAKKNKLPSWDDLKEVKDIFIGPDKLAVQVLPPASRFININPYCLHLWMCLDGDPVPDFARGGRSI